VARKQGGVVEKCNAIETVSYTFDEFIVRDAVTKQHLYIVPFAVYEKMHAMVTDKEAGPIIKKVRAR
jgi:hypothetical protein